MRPLTVTDFTGTSVQDFLPESHDYFVRLSKETTSDSWKTHVAKVDVDALWCWGENKQQEIQTLQSVVAWQHKLLDYNAHYCAFLLGQVDEDEFEGIAESYAYEPKDISPNVLSPIVERIYALTGIEYTPSDLAGLFECKTENVLEALKPLAVENKKLRDLLPQSQE